MSPGHVRGSPLHGSPQCMAVREVLNLVGDKWSLLLIFHLSGGPKRFSELKRTVEGISQRMLTLTLRGLERDGLVIRTVYPTVPPQVDYALTPLGQTLREPVSALATWAEESREKMQLARDQFDQRATRASVTAVRRGDPPEVAAPPGVASTRQRSRRPD